MLLLIFGIILYAVTVHDILKTTLSMEGGGWLTNHFSKFLWKVSFLASRKKGDSKLLGKTGYLILTGIIILWVALLWSSFCLVLFSDPGSVVTSANKTAVQGVEKLYFAGYTISTLGSGEYIAGNDFWRIITNVFSFTGLVLLTMSVTYFVPLLQAVIDQQKLAVQISCYGRTPQEMIINAYDGEHYQGLTANASDLTLSLIKHTQNHKAYPVIHYFHNSDKRFNIILELSKMHECFVILENLMDDQYQPAENELRSLKVAFENYFKIITEITDAKDQATNEAPKIKTDLLLEQNFISRKKNLPDLHSRKVFSKLVENDGWGWNDIQGSDAS
ncbi:potassium channel family protein [Zunongwangia endophytica]|uniref:Potassium channel family protein n=1 Tax=Zunongwangia endophytica TaxID=1808945 RepID=A0ABV8H4K4_9FLAO|nr:potassium channel family protein [Zunongwangia endophytica]MDN3595548.1 potassium channel family protein [Zunongwangia endophytica]